MPRFTRLVRLNMLSTATLRKHCRWRPTRGATLVVSVTRQSRALTLTPLNGIQLSGLGGIYARNHMSNFDENAQQASDLISISEVYELTKVPAPTWRTWTAKGIAPKGIKMGPRKTLWRKSDVLAFMASRTAA